MAVKTRELPAEVPAEVPAGRALAYLKLRRGGLLVLDRPAWEQKKLLVWRCYPPPGGRFEIEARFPRVVPFQQVKAQPKHHGTPTSAAIGSPVVCLEPEAMLRTQGHTAWPLLGFLGAQLGQGLVWIYCRSARGRWVKINVPIKQLKVICDTSAVQPTDVSKIEDSEWILYS